MKSGPVYKDFWFKIAGSFVASQVIDSINREESYFKRFTNKYFYTDLLGGFVIALRSLYFFRRSVRKILPYFFQWTLVVPAHPPFPFSFVLTGNWS